MKTLIVSDIHSNLPALEAVVKAEPDFQKCIFLGDVVDYGPFPRECIQFLRDHMDVGVLGNHDNAMARGVDCGCRGDFRHFSEETRAWHKTLLGDEDLDFLRRLQPLEQTHVDGETLYLAHATPKGDLFHYLHEGEMEEAVEGIPADFILLGHTHVQFKKLIGRTLVVNPGSVGLARDGGKACYAVLRDGKVSLYRADYDVERTISALEKAPLSADTLEGLSRVLHGLPLE